jgi:ribonuclease HI
MLSAPVLKGQLGKWMFALSEFDIRYQPAKAVKGQALVDLIVETVSTNIAVFSIRAWTMYFDGSVCGDGCGISIFLVLPQGATYSFSIRLHTACTNNLAEYEAMRRGMELLLEVGAEAVVIFGDSKLVISQLIEDYRCESELLFPLWVQCQELMTQFMYINFYWIPRAQNSEANNLAQMALGYKAVTDGANRLLHEVHEGSCGTHQSAQKMKWLIRRSGYYWPTMLQDCFKYYKGCQAC